MLYFLLSDECFVVIVYHSLPNETYCSFHNFKTIQTIGFLSGLQALPKCSVRGPFLIVAPLSLVTQWESETREWAPDVNAIVYHGSGDARDFLVKNEFYYTEQFETKGRAKELKKNHVTKFQILITTYEVAMKDISILSKIE